jgi:hypothetical protein
MESTASGMGGGAEPAGGCEMLQAQLAVALADLQACEADEDCGASVSEGTCGCTLAVPSRTDADPTQYIDLVRRVSECTQEGGSVCDCPPADGFICDQNRCAWNYLE